ncbi:unnamed protein product [Lactuca saligna]|uniref:Uncharacterized protein n=1 Tax=Lactuca saligna TaxID=75948 RepID=A0AA36DWN9_LACSI|nr:unnamed protein product [Lactuca saligna]
MGFFVKKPMTMAMTMVLLLSTISLLICSSYAQGFTGDPIYRMPPEYDTSMPGTGSGITPISRYVRVVKEIDLKSIGLRPRSEQKGFVKTLDPTNLPANNQKQSITYSIKM